MQTSRHAHAFASPLLWLCLALPFVIHCLLLYCYSVNAPRLDDFSDGLSLLPLFQQSDTLAERIRLLFSLYQNHRWGLLHSIYFAAGRIDFRLANFLSLLPLLALPWLWYRQFRRETYVAALVLIAVLLVFNLQAWTGLFWITASLAAIPVVPLALLAFMLVTQERWSAFAGAIAVTAVATFTNGNGILLWPIAALYLGYRVVCADNGQARAMLGCWLVSAAVLLFLYFSRSVLSHEIPGTNNIHGALETLLAHPVLFVQGFLATLGSVAMYHTSGLSYKVPLAIALGSVELLALAVLVWRGALQRHPAILLLALFLLGTCAAIGATRVTFIGIEQAFQGHYKLYNGTFLLILASAWLDHACRETNSRNVTASLLASAAVLYGVSLWWFVPAVRDYHRELATDTRNWLHSNTLQMPETRFFVSQFNRKLSAAVQAGVYDPWSLLSARQTAHSTALPHCPEGLATAAAALQSQKNAVAVHVVASLPQPVEQLYLCSSQQAMAITLTTDHYTRNENGTYSVELWVPRHHNINHDEGPWQLYLPH